MNPEKCELRREWLDWWQDFLDRKTFMLSPTEGFWMAIDRPNRRAIVFGYGEEYLAKTRILNARCICHLGWTYVEQEPLLTPEECAFWIVQKTTREGLLDVLAQPPAKSTFTRRVVREVKVLLDRQKLEGN